MAVPNLETRLARLEQGLPDATALRAGFVALRRLSTGSQMNPDDVVTFDAMLRTSEQQVKGLTDEELREGIQLLQAYITLKQGAPAGDSNPLGVSAHAEH